MTGLEWEKIVDFDNYSVSNYGDVRNDKTNQILKPYITDRKYVYVYIKDNSGKYYNLQVHRLVAQAFIPNPLNKPNINHKDFNPSNNCIENLEWVTQSENCLYSSEHIKAGRTYKGHSKDIKHKISLCALKLDRDLPTHIYHNNKYFIFKIMVNNKRFSKSFKNLCDAIQFRENFLKEIDYEF